MNRNLKHSSFYNVVLCIVLLSQVWANGHSFCYWLIDANTDYVELLSAEESESEEENKKEKTEKIFDNTLFNKRRNLLKSKKILYLIKIPLVYCPEIATPPPKLG